MGCAARDLAPSGAIKFEVASKCLLPNEDVRFVCEIRGGFLVLTNRRIVLLEECSYQDYEIGIVLPFDCYHLLAQIKRDQYRISGISLDRNGLLEPKGAGNDIDVRLPKVNQESSKSDVLDQFHSTMSLFHDMLESIRETLGIGHIMPQPHDYSYFDQAPRSLTENAKLDLNTILEDKPIYQELWNEAKTFLGNSPFLLEESLRAGDDPTNGALFAAGEKGIIWIQGRKSGRFISNVLVDKLEWPNIKCLVYRWQLKKPIFEATYSLQKGMKDFKRNFIWNPPVNRDTTRYQWLLQKLNGPWILADLMYRYSGNPMPASCSKVLKDSNLQRRRFFM
ncbi:MAG: hypothetical protein ACFFAY_12905 [Promethearchaeota archaeon]